MNSTSNVNELERAADCRLLRNTLRRGGIGSVILAALVLAFGADLGRAAEEIRPGRTVQLENGATFTAEKWGANWGEKTVVIGTFHDPPTYRTYGSTPLQCHVVRGYGRNVPDVYLDSTPTGPIKLSKDLTPSGMKSVWNHEKWHRDVQPLETRVSPGLNNLARQTLSPSGYQTWLGTQGLTRDQGELRANLAEMNSRDFRSAPRNAQFSQRTSWGEYRQQKMQQVTDQGKSAYFQATGKSFPIDNSYYDVNRGCVVKGSGQVDPGKAATVLSVAVKVRSQDFRGVSPSISVPAATLNYRFGEPAHSGGSGSSASPFNSRVPVDRHSLAAPKMETPRFGAASAASATLCAPNLDAPAFRLPTVHNFAVPRFDGRRASGLGGLGSLPPVHSPLWTR